MNKSLAALQEFYAMQDIIDAWDAGQASFLAYSPRNTLKLYDLIYTDTAVEFCTDAKIFGKKPDARALQVINFILGFPAFDIQPAQNLPTCLRPLVEAFLPEIESINYNLPLGYVLETLATAKAITPTTYAILSYISQSESDGADIPALHAKILGSAQIGRAEVYDRAWAKIIRTIDAEKGLRTAKISPPKP